jgi:heat shock protein HtpX
MRLRVMITTILVFGLVAAVIGLLINMAGFGGSNIIFVWMLASFVMIGIQWYFGPNIIKWSTGAKELKRESAPELFETVQRLTQKARLPMPKLYMVDNPTPNAFAFGRTQSSSNIAVHAGLLSALNKEEVEGVLAHEIGHINNRDVAVMTLASVLPVLLYYGFLIFGRDEDGRGSLGTILGAFVAQFIGQLLVMALSRQREYFADEFSARITGNPSHLMAALAKITYGQAAGAKSSGNNMASALYIAEPSSAKMSFAEIARAINSGDEAELASAIEKEKKGGAVELLMTHPLTAKRLEKLNRLRKGMAA